MKFHIDTTYTSSSLEVVNDYENGTDKENYRKLLQISAKKSKL